MRTLDSNSKLHVKIKVSIKVNTWAIMKASIIVTAICSAIVCFLHDLND